MPGQRIISTTASNRQPTSIAVRSCPSLDSSANWKYHGRPAMYRCTSGRKLRQRQRRPAAAGIFRISGSRPLRHQPLQRRLCRRRARQQERRRCCIGCRQFPQHHLHIGRVAIRLLPRHVPAQQLPSRPRVQARRDHPDHQQRPDHPQHASHGAGDDSPVCHCPSRTNPAAKARPSPIAPCTIAATGATSTISGLSRYTIRLDSSIGRARTAQQRAQARLDHQVVAGPVRFSHTCASR